MMVSHRPLRAALIASVSVSAILATTTARSQDNTVEEVLVTGSLIRGSEAVGVPVQALAAKDFAEAGSVNVGDMMRNVPATVMLPISGSTNHGQSEEGSQINFHGLDSFNASRDLLMVDGMRVPAGAHNSRQVDPTIIPIIAIDHVDILVDGASATYGSDAVSGVVNIILKRGYDGARTSIRAGKYPGGGDQYQADFLWGRTWDGGDVTISYEWYDQKAIPNIARSNMTTDFTPWGLDDRTQLGASIPGVISLVKPTSTTSTQCTNCFSIPRGQNGVGLAYATILANPGVKNLVRPYDQGDALPRQQRNGAVITLDQRIFDGVEFFATGYSSNRRVQLVQSGAIAKPVYATYLVPSNNPYYPAGAPAAGLMFTGNFLTELPPFTTGHQTDGRYDLGFNIDLPFSWHSKIYMSQSQVESETKLYGMAHAAKIAAALGNTNKATGPYAAYIKPANIPYLNVFCDTSAFTCNSQSTLDYIEGWRDQNTRSLLAEKGVNFDGPLFSLPGGEVRAAIGATYTRYNVEYYDVRGDVDPQPAYLFDPEKKTWWAIFGQVNVPIFSDMNAVPLIEKLEIEGSWRHDQYSDVGGTSNPKVAVNWQPIDSLTIRGTWGTSFRAPAFQETSPLASQSVSGFNSILGSGLADTIAVTCTGGKPVAGSAAAAVNPTCNPALLFPGGLSPRGSAGTSAFLRPGGGLNVSPEIATNYGLGLEFVPTDFLKGLNVQVTYYKLHISNILTSIDVSASNFNDPAFAFLYITPASVGTAEFNRLLDQAFTIPANAILPASKTNVLWLEDGGARNLGYLIQDGFDFSARYDWDMSDQGLGLWETEIVGTYTLKSVTSTGIPGSATIDAFHQTLNSGLLQAVGVEARPRYVYRARLGWSDMGWTVTGFFNYSSHYFTTQTAPAAAFFTKFPSFSNLAPEYHTFDLSIGYNTGDTPANDYLKNLNLQLVFNNILNKYPPFQYNNNALIGSTGAYDPSYGDNGRLVQMTITKDW